MTDGRPGPPPSPAASRGARVAAGPFVAIVTLVVALAGVVIAPPELPHGRSVPDTSIPRPQVHVRVENWSGQNVNVSAACSACATNLTAGGTVNLTLAVRPACGPFGCSPRLLAIVLPGEFGLRSIVPALPASLRAAGVNLTLSVRLPFVSGEVVLSGEVVGAGVPGPVVLTSQVWAVENATNGTGGLTVTGPSPGLEVAPNRTFNETLTVNNTSPDRQRVIGVAVQPPFQLVAATPGFPFEINPNETGVVGVEVLAPPANGSYALYGTVRTDLLPLVIIDRIVVVVTSGSPLTVSNVSIPTRDLPGEEFNGSLDLTNPDAVAHAVAFNRTNAAFLFVNITPNGTTTIAAGSTVRFHLTFSVLVGPGTYELDLYFRQVF